MLGKHQYGGVWQQAQGLGSTLIEIFGGLKTPLSNAALAISQGMKGGLISAFPEILASLGSLIGSIGGAFVAMLDAIAAALFPTGFGTPQALLMIAAGVALAAVIAGIVASIGGSFSKKGSSGRGSSSGGSSGSGGMGSVDITTGTGSLEDAINANTKALEKTNSALADMIRQAGALVLSDNMRLGSTVAASGTAQVVSAANSYHREGDTTINQYIQSKAQSAADLARETFVIVAELDLHMGVERVTYDSLASCCFEPAENSLPGVHYAVPKGLYRGVETCAKRFGPVCEEDALGQ